MERDTKQDSKKNAQCCGKVYPVEGVDSFIFPQG
jgi:hypothetical protein